MWLFNYLFKHNTPRRTQEEIVSEVFCDGDQEYANKFYSKFLDSNYSKHEYITVKTDLWPKTWPEYLEGWPHDGYFGNILFYFPPLRNNNMWVLAIDEDGEHFTLEMDRSTGDIYFIEIVDEFIREISRELGISDVSDDPESNRTIIARSFTDLCTQLNYSI